MSLIPPSGFNVLQSSAEIHLAAFEALTFVLKASVPVISSSAINCIREVDNSSDILSKDMHILDSLVLKFLNHINGFLAGRQLARTRRAVLMNWKVLPYMCSACYFGVSIQFRLSVPSMSLQLNIVILVGS